MQTVAYRVHKVRFAQSYSAPQKNGVIRFAGVFRNAARNGRGVLVAFAYYEVIEGVLRNEYRFVFAYRNKAAANGQVYFFFYFT